MLIINSNTNMIWSQGNDVLRDIKTGYCIDIYCLRLVSFLVIAEGIEPTLSWLYE
jgi:hypothetical protein